MLLSQKACAKQKEKEFFHDNGGFTGILSADNLTSDI
jgi:hypothetical protein